MTKPYCIAEIGGNHEGDFDKALELINLALCTPVDAIKFQTYFANTLVDRSTDPKRWQHFRRFEFTLEQHELIAKKIISSGKDYITSIWDSNAYNVLSPYIKYVKIGSGDMDSYSFLKLAARFQKPIILSTGLSTLSEVKRSVKLIRDFNPLYNERRMIYVLQCTTMYPIEFEEANLDVMTNYRTLGTKVGYSDHTIGSSALKLAAVLGADMLEFHFSDNNKNTSFRDHLVSLEKDHVNELYAYFDEVSKLRGSALKEPTKSEIDTGHIKSFRRGTYAVRDLDVNEYITDQDICEKRPVNSGLKFENLLGKKIVKSVSKGSPIYLRNIEIEK